MPERPEVKILRKKSYLAMIRNAAKGESRMFRNVYALVDDAEMDITGDGRWSCAFFVSVVLYANKLIGDMHTGVAGLEEDLKANGWQETKDLKEGAVIVWEPQKGNFVPGIGEMHSHLGFFVGNDRAVSNSSDETGVPKEHHITYNGARKIERIWWHSDLEE